MVPYIRDHQPNSYSGLCRLRKWTKETNRETESLFGRRCFNGPSSIHLMSDSQFDIGDHAFNNDRTNVVPPPFPRSGKPWSVSLTTISPSYLPTTRAWTID